MRSQIGKNKKNITGTGCEILSDQITLFWNRKDYKLIIPLSRQNNVATFYMAPGFKKFDLFCQSADIDYELACIIQLYLKHQSYL